MVDNGYMPRKRTPQIVRVFSTPTMSLQAARQELNERLLIHTYHSLAGTTTFLVNFCDQAAADNFESKVMTYVGQVV